MKMSIMILLLVALPMIAIDYVTSKPPAPDMALLWRDEYSKIFTSRRVLDQTTCRKKLEVLVKVENSGQFIYEVSSLSRRMVELLSSVKFRDYHHGNDEFIKLSLLRKKKSYGSNLIRLSDEKTQGCDVQHLNSIVTIYKSLTRRTSVLKYVKDSLIDHILSCHLEYLNEAQRKKKLLSKEQIIIIENLYKSITTVMRSTVRNRPDKDLDDLIAQGLMYYLLRLENPALDEYDFALDFELVFEDEISKPCQIFCYQTRNLKNYFETSTKYLKEETPYLMPSLQQFPIVDGHVQSVWEQIRFCCKIGSLSKSFISLIETKYRRQRKLR